VRATRAPSIHAVWVEEGMTAAEAEAAFGRPPDAVLTRPTPPDPTWLRHEVKRRVWTGDGGGVQLGFDGQERVVRVTGWMTASRLQWLADLLGW
jgi:hypothetical protein